MRTQLTVMAGAMAAISAFAPAAARADDAYFRVPIKSVTIVEGKFPTEYGTPAHRSFSNSGPAPYAVLDGSGEAVIVAVDNPAQPFETYESDKGWTYRDGFLLAKAPTEHDLSGWMYLPNADDTALIPLKFTAKAAPAPEAKQLFLAAREARYREWSDDHLPGAAWFRLMADEAAKERGDQPSPRTAWRRRPADFDDTYDLFSGGRAISDNLQLNRTLPARPDVKDDEKSVPIAGIEGITVASIDWPAASGSAPPVDALASAIPADQHAAFFPNFEALATLFDEAERSALPMYHTFAQQSQDGRAFERYQRQLGLQASSLARALGPKLVRSAAITGSDPYFPTGTDVALVFDTPDSAALRTLLLGEMRMNSAKVVGVVSNSGSIDGLKYDSVSTPDRAVCSYVAAVSGTTVVVTNSTVQLRKLAAVASGSTPAIASLPEYGFFRRRYPAGAAGETGFVFLSDATIRRWCSAEWRIGASRRLRAAALLADVTASHMDELVAGVATAHAVDPPMPMQTIGEVTIGPGGVASSVYGSLAFLTPIAELGIASATPDEAAAYKRWRDSYQQNWDWALDPIALSFSLTPGAVSADLTVMPIILGSGYKMWMDVARGSSIEAGAGDPHDAVAHLAVAVNPQARALTEAAGMARSMAHGVEIDPLGWLGKSVALYADADPLWAELASKAPGGAMDESDRAFEESLPRLPIALNAEVGSPMKLAAFLAAARSYIDQSAPGMLAWESHSHNGQAYVKVGLAESARRPENHDPFDQLAIYYAPTARALIVSLREDVLTRALDRQAEQKGVAPMQAHPWLGSSLCFQLQRSYLELGDFWGRNGVEARRRRAWASIPILNEWKHRYADRDPLVVHEQQWGERLVGPGGGGYQWNERFWTMESVDYGSPGDPRTPEGTGGPDPLAGVSGINLGITFEDKGLRAKAVIERAAKTP